MKYFLFKLALLALLIYGFGVPARAQDPKVADLLKEVGIDQNLGRQIPLDLKFSDEAGKETPLKQYFNGRPVILALVYYQCPMLCNLVLEGILRSLNSMTLNAAQDYEVIAVSINPKETFELAATKKSNYLREYRRGGGEQGWHFLTGSAESIEPLARAVGFRYVYLPEKDQYAHASGIMIATPEGKLSRYFYGIEYSPRDLRLGLIEASSNRIGTVVDQLLLFCYHYDPAAGKYNLAIMAIIRGAGILTVLLISGTVLFWIRRERARRTQIGAPSGEAISSIPQREGIESR